MSSRSILLVEDDVDNLTSLASLFEKLGWQVSRARTGEAGLDLYDQERPDLVLLDLHLPGKSGLELLELLRQKDPEVTAVMLTGHGDIGTAVEAMRLGAENFLTKPVEFGHLKAVVERAIEKVELRRQTRYLAGRQTEAGGLDSLGSSPAMRELARRVELLAGGETTVLLQGETGTGKGWVAKMLHTLSPRAARPFVEVNCAGLTATFLDSELFGHERGAFTDARQQKRGLFEIADRGTLFLDEVGDLAPELQPKLLTVLESRRFRRLGGTREIDVDVRVIAATNRDLATAVRQGRFREDLYYRLAVVPLRLPPLRERGREAVTELVSGLWGDLCRRLGRGPVDLSPEALKLLTRYSWPGNIREMRNVLERVLLLAGDARHVEIGHLPGELFAGDGAASQADTPHLPLAELERRHIARVLEYHGGNRTRAAKTLGISRVGLYKKLQRFGLEDIGLA